MTMKNPSGRSLPVPPVTTDEKAEQQHRQLSAIGWLCNEILAAVNHASGFPDGQRKDIALRVSGILDMFSESEKKSLAAQMKISALKRDLRSAKEQMKVLRDKLFGNSSEQDSDPDSDLGFAGDEPDEDDETEEEARAKGKSARKIPEDIRVVRVDHYPEDTTCCTCGCRMKSIKAEERVGRFQIVPEHVILIQDIYHSVACGGELCKANKPVLAKAQGYIMRNRTVDAGLIVEAAIQKWFESTATYRMERRMINNNINLARQTIGRNLAHLSRFLRPVCMELLEHIRAGAVAHMDETPLRVQAPGTGKSDIGYLWAICRDERRWNPEAQPAVYYEYANTRSGHVAEKLVEGSSIEFLQTDGYAAYNRLFRDGEANGGISSVRCWAHTRRKFHETLKATDSKLAGWAKKRINALYKIEKTAAGLPPAAREAIRQDKSLPILGEIRKELCKAEAVAQGELKKAIAYTLKAFDALARFAFDGRLELDNNPIERCMRLIALAKKNSVGAGSHEAAHTWAIFYTLIESARLNHINPRAYLNWVVGEIERTGGDIDYSQLMPWHCPVGKLED